MIFGIQKVTYLFFQNFVGHVEHVLTLFSHRKLEFVMLPRS